MLLWALRADPSGAEESRVQRLRVRDGVPPLPAATAGAARHQPHGAQAACGRHLIVRWVFLKR